MTGQRPTYECPVERALDVLGGKWRAVILAYLKEGPRRYGELRALIPRLSEKMLTQRLRELQDQGLVERQRADAPGAYRLSPRGESLRPVLEALYVLGTRLAEEDAVDRALTADTSASAAGSDLDSL